MMQIVKPCIGFKDKIWLFDGAMGTMLQSTGVKAGECLELVNLERPALVTEVHRAYVMSGADIIETNTFGANRIRLAEFGLADAVERINAAGVAAARAACAPHTKVAGAVGPTGRYIGRDGFSFNEAQAVFYEQLSALDKAGVDLIVIETMIDIAEARAALLAAKAATRRPVIVQLAFGPNGRTYSGTDPATAAIVLAALQPAAIGVNCSRGPQHLLPIVLEMGRWTSLPLCAQPSAGLPEIRNGQAVYPVTPEEFAAWMVKFLAAGVKYIGGCCGTTPAHIRAVRKTLAALKC